MTAGKETTSNNTLCLICDASMGVSTRKCCPIFEQRVSSSERIIVSVISSILGENLTEENVHSNVICKKCFKTCNEVDELEERLSELKVELKTSYQRTYKKQTSGEKDSDSTVTEEKTEQKKNETSPKKRKRGRPSKKGPANNDEDETTSLIELLEGENENAPASNTVAAENGTENEDEIIELNGEEVDSPERESSNQDVQIKMEAMEDEEDEENENENDNDNDNENENENDDDEDEDDDEEKKQAKKKRKTEKSAKKTKKPKEVLIPQMVVSRENETYTCLICNVENKFSSDARGITNHVKEKHDIRLYICDVCGVEFFKRSELSKHLDEHITNEDDTFECDVCHRTFNNFRLYRVHKKMHNSSQKNYTCDVCGKRFGSRNLLEEHNNIHTGERPYCCSSCGKSFTSKYTLKSHEKTHEDRPRPYPCINCGKAFLTQQNLIHHERIHSGIKNYICQECGKSFNTARNLETHCVIHTGFKPFICRLCGKAFSRKPEIRDHERTHTGEKPYQCEFCGASFGQRSNLQSHKRSTHYDDKRYKCTDCGRAFKRRRLLDYHMKAAHTGERPYKCTICLATFIYPEHFKKHKLIHTGEKPYECEVCGKAFNSRDNRNAHRFVHSDKKPYECLVCGLGFMRKPLLYNHMNTAGHQNDTIVVNQPRLTTDEVLTNISTTSTATAIQPQIEMTIITDEEGNQKLVPTNSLTQEVGPDQKLYIHEMKEHILIPDEQNPNQQHNLHIVMDGQVEVQYASQHELGTVHHVQTANAIVPDDIQITSDGSAVVVPHSENSTITYHQEPATIKTDSGPIQIVQIRLSEDSEEQKQWINLLQAQHQA
ncbi:zinc finger protein 623-like [Planococcus citri]|uniref:zinc finger protein 623-like n=1 Tax=Planococcus citri TaxID=170843 RepID=UPI0031F75284